MHWNLTPSMRTFQFNFFGLTFERQFGCTSVAIHEKKQSSSSTQIVLEVCFTFGSERTCACGYLWFLIRVVTIPHCYMLSLYPTSTGNIRRPSHKTAITPNDNGSCVLVFNNMKLWEHTIGVLLVSLSFLYSAWYLYKIRKIHLMSKSTRACRNLKAPSPPSPLSSIALPDWPVGPLGSPNSQVGSTNGQIGVSSIECKAGPSEFSSVWAMILMTYQR